MVQIFPLQAACVDIKTLAFQSWDILDIIVDTTAQEIVRQWLDDCSCKVLICNGYIEILICTISKFLLQCQVILCKAVVECLVKSIGNLCKVEIVVTILELVQNILGYTLKRLHIS